MEKAPRKLGKFTVTLSIVESMWPTLAPIMQVVVVETRIRYPDCIEYTAFGEMFDEVQEGAFIPEYQPTFTRQEDGSTTVQWERQE